MPRQPTPGQLYDELLTRYGRKVADAFASAIQSMAKAADLQRMITAIQAGNVLGALDALNLNPADYSPVLEALRESFVEGGQVTTGFLPTRRPNGIAAIFRFDVRNPRAEAWLREQSSKFVTEIMNDQREAVRAALVAGMERGQNPRTVALDVVGRINRTTGQREGGVLGLTSKQEGYVRNAQAELSSGDPAQLRAYLGRARRDKRFDRTIKKAIADETPVPAAMIAKATTRYKARLLQLRGEVIGRTEALTSLNASQFEALKQAVESGQVEASQIRRVWRSAGDLRVRDTHAALSGDTAGLEESFVSPSGARLRYPGDPSAPVGERVNCRCWVMPRIDWGANLT